MKKLTLLAAALLVSACGDQGNNTAAVSNAPLTPVAAPNGGDWTQMVRQTPEGGMLMGNPDAKVKVVEFGSMTCHVCAEFSEEADQKLREQYVKSGQVSFEFRNFVRDGADLAASLITRCAGPTPQFFRLTEAMYANQEQFLNRLQAIPPEQGQALQSLPPAQQFQQLAKLTGLQEFAAQRGLPSGRTSQCLSNQAEIDRLVQMNSDASSQYQIPGTPTFLINGEVVGAPESGQTNWQNLERRIREALGS